MTHRRFALLVATVLVAAALTIWIGSLVTGLDGLTSAAPIALPLLMGAWLVVWLLNRRSE